jgi:hypothetical protein
MKIKTPVSTKNIIKCCMKIHKILHAKRLRHSMIFKNEKNIKIISMRKINFWFKMKMEN